MNVVLLALATASYAAHCWSAVGHFRYVDGVPYALMALSTVWAAAFAAQAAALWPGRALAPTAWLALPFFLAALLLWLWTVRASRRARLSVAFSRDTPTRLLDAGPYRLIRHPFYTGYALNWFAGCVATWHWWVIAPSVAAAVMLAIAARSEERKFARSPLAADYAAYRARTGMFLPRLRRGSRRT
ncbi:MAG: isoprenylcysteine carboxylmethyltransferase family protein [Alphaproteobacteria bacterium]|nr:isoprenylcysteine carboxylmethyltransferase family protein [Alphaproteobacteria bacterium]